MHGPPQQSDPAAPAGPLGMVAEAETLHPQRHQQGPARLQLHLPAGHAAHRRVALGCEPPLPAPPSHAPPSASTTVTTSRPASTVASPAARATPPAASARP